MIGNRCGPRYFTISIFWKCLIGWVREQAHETGNRKKLETVNFGEQNLKISQKKNLFKPPMQCLMMIKNQTVNSLEFLRKFEILIANVCAEKEKGVSKKGFNFNVAADYFL